MGIDTALVAIAMASVPLLHRFGSLAPPLVLGHIFNVVTTLGTADGSWMGYLTAAALGMLLIGIKRIGFSVRWRWWRPA